MAKAKRVSRIIWSVDAFPDHEKLQIHTAEALLPFVKDARAKIEAVYVLSPDELNFGLEAQAPWIEHYRPAAEKSLKSLLESVGLPSSLKPKVLTQPLPSTGHAVKALAAYALTSGADAIAVGTHGRKGMPRLFLGSFAESLLFESRVPVLVVGPKSRVPEHYARVLFATDLSPGSRALFDGVIDLAKTLGAGLILYHCLQNPIAPVFQSGVYLLGGGWVAFPNFYEDELERRRKIAESWRKAAEKAGVPVEVALVEAGGGVVSSVVNYARRKKVDLIALAAQSGPVASAIIGSITRQVVRQADCPVWVLHAARKRK